MNMQFIVTSAEGVAYKDSDIWVPKTSVFNPRARFVQMHEREAWLLSASEAVSRYDSVFARQSHRTRGAASRRIVYTGPAGSHYNVLFETGECRDEASVGDLVTSRVTVTRMLTDTPMLTRRDHPLHPPLQTYDGGDRRPTGAGLTSDTPSPQ